MIFSYMDIHPTDAVQVIGHLLHLSKLALSYLSKGMSLLLKSNEIIYKHFKTILLWGSFSVSLFTYVFNF